MTQKSPPSNSLLSRALRAGLVGIGTLALFAGMSSGCLDRPVAPARPGTTNVFVDQIIQSAVDKIDLLFMIDNSRSMADKQIILGEAVPVLLERLINPQCIDPASGALSPPVNNQCNAPLEREFGAIDNIHIGIVTSSLGGHGADTCSPASGTQFDPSQDDKAQLLPSVRPNLPQYQQTGFLVWDPSSKHNPPGEGNSTTLINNFRTEVTATGEIGCGFEASLEAWYRFLIDPAPPSDVVQQNGEAMVQRPNQLVLNQRAAFLRPDSLVAVIMLTDENDCSTFDGGIAWLSGQGSGTSGNQFVLPKSTSACNQNPNDKCCRSCNSIETGGPPAGCQATNVDPQCANPYHSEQTDALNLRCWDQKRRFGVDFLYGIGRYVEGLTSLSVHDFTGAVVANPLYSDLSGANQPARPQGLVFLAGIIGVPWQDIATDETIGNPNDLKYLTAAQLNNANPPRWPVILGDPYNYVLPGDPLMIESPFPRTDPALGINPSHPIAGQPALVPPPPGGQLRGNSINGNEYIPPSVNDLQYSCIFPLATARQCGNTGGCDCSQSDQGQGKPLCNGTDQTHAKAYPGLRHLQVLKGIGETVPGVNNAIVASICPKITDRGNPAYGYNPAVASIIERLKEQLGGKCLPRPLEVNPETGNVPCAVVEAIYTPGSCNCDPAAGRADIFGGQYEALVGPVYTRLQSIQQCGGSTTKACEDFCLCEIRPADAGPARDTCLSDPNAVNAGNQFGYCYVDPEAGYGTEELVAKCPASGKRKLQFIGQNTPAKGSIAFIACLGSPVSDADGGF